MSSHQKIKCYIKELSLSNEEHVGSFRVDTINENLHVIQKRCLTDSDSYLERLIDYVENDSDIEMPIIRMCKANNVSDIETKQLIDIVKKYQREFDVEDCLLDTRNMGLLINKTNPKPVVWGRLKMRRNMLGQIDE